MQALKFVSSEKGVVVTGKTFGVKEILKAHGASWSPEAVAWIFRGKTDVEAVRSSIDAEVEAVATAAAGAKKAHREFLKTPEGHAHAIAEARARVIATRATPDGGWICCDDAMVADWGRKHTFCSKHAFCVRGMCYTGD